MSDLSDIKSFLKQRAAKPPERPASAFEAIKSLLPEIVALKRKRYTDREIRDLLAEKGLNVSLGTFQQYINRAKRLADKNTATSLAPTPAKVQTKKVELEKRLGSLGHRLNEDL